MEHVLITCVSTGLYSDARNCGFFRSRQVILRRQSNGDACHINSEVLEDISQLNGSSCCWHYVELLKQKLEFTDDQILRSSLINRSQIERHINILAVEEHDS